MWDVSHCNVSVQLQSHGSPLAFSRIPAWPSLKLLSKATYCQTKSYISTIHLGAAVLAAGGYTAQ